MIWELMDKMNLWSGFIFSVIVIAIFYYLMRIFLKKKFNIELDILPERCPEDKRIYFIQPLIMVVGIIIALVLELTYIYLKTYIFI